MDKREKLNKKKYITISIIILILIAVSITFNIICLIESVSPSVSSEEIKNLEVNTEISHSFEFEDGIIGYIQIEKIGLKAPIKEGTEEETLNKYVGHFTETALLDGNVCFAAHNRGYENNYFENLHKLENGDKINYITKFQEKSYKVVNIKEIKDTDVSVLEGTEDNRITLITCIANKGDKRLCVQAVEE